ncbi:hypothetical protein NEF87_002822 [Candidatus Lokiarchaeum ossiferum]|uniref:ArnR1-like winged helix-turn-helix domain-containing protein n=1 Tax=Candidatus Lokiarchaeum ossiferum TaxID=2951803 RepID=A0ABY6HVZ7_9ARCH|nr:hypothetical protein NEF87_002822 [Candidatus Lokiarchaeum sp. B-35]
MAPAQLSDDNLDCTKQEIEELKSYKFLLGDYGIAMLVAIARGAQNCESIRMLSGVPPACITGRMPVLLNLKLIEATPKMEYLITECGRKFLKCIDENV